jgi:hypothetical protein
VEKKARTPQEKKQLSLKKDRRNVYGENAKASRKNIPKRKAQTHQEVRRKAKQGLENSLLQDEATGEVTLSTIGKPNLQKGDWRKWPDKPLGEVLKHKRTRGW